ncbi:MAG TPA: hypothetical protein VKA60_02345 [Blastocatellia bacterium]|nr:hypothetical protein [Blastocatellia bacterium]
MQSFSSFTLILFMTLMLCPGRSTGAPVVQDAQSDRDAIYRREGRGDMSGAQVFDDIGKTQVGQIAATVHEIQALGSQTDSQLPGEVPKAIRGLLTTLKHQLRDIIIKQVNARASRSSPARMRAAARAALAGYGVPVGEPEAWTHDPFLAGYGYVLGLEIERPASHPDLLVAKTRLAIPCGDDTSFYLFKRNAGRYELALALEANGYETLLGAQSSFAYSISPPDGRGNFFVVAADVNAWCTSRWQGLRYKVMRIGSSPYEPQFIARAEHGVLIDKAPMFKLTTRVDGFRLSFWEAQSLDGGIMERRYVLNYALTGSGLKRIAPLAFRPEDFLDEWIHLPWAAASEWVEPSRLAELQSWHERLQAHNNHCCSEFDLDALRPYRPRLKTWRVVVNFSDELAGQLPPRVAFKISRRRGTFFIEDIRPKT